MKNILFVISTLTGGGAERTVSTLSKFFSEEMNCTVLLNSQSENDYDFCGDVISLGMKPRVKKNIVYQIIAAIKRYTKLKELKKTGKYDVVVSFMESANFLNVITGKNNCKLILSVRNVISEEYRGIYKVILYVARKLYGRADYVVSLSEGARRDLIDNMRVPEDKCITIYNGYDISKFHYVEKKNKKAFISMGRLVHQKGQWHLIRAFNRVNKLYPETTLKILGQGELEGYLRKLIEYYGLENSVELIGFVNNPAEYLQESSCFVFSSVYEGFGNAIIEAMMNGLPVITSEFSVAREILAPELATEEIVGHTLACQYGILVPSSSPEYKEPSQVLGVDEIELANAMIGWVEGKYGNKYNNLVLRECLERFSIDKAIDRWKRIIYE